MTENLPELDNQFRSNLFANSDLYYGVIFDEQINMKTKYAKLINIIDFQQSRYKEFQVE